jgi:hypothetical protein
VKLRCWLEIEAEIKDLSGFIPELHASWFRVIKDKNSDEAIRLTGSTIFKNIRISGKDVFERLYRAGHVGALCRKIETFR